MDTILEYLISFFCIGLFFMCCYPTKYWADNIINEKNKHYIGVFALIICGILFNAIFMDLRTEILSWFGIVSYGVEYQ